MHDTEVLIVGAGPTGLVLALYLAHNGLKPRIIERNPGPGEASRAMAVHARTLEFYRQLGFGEDVVAHGIHTEQIRLRRGARQIARLDFRGFGDGLSPYPFVLTLPQDEHERLLVEQLSAAGVEVEWNTQLAAFREEGDHVQVTLRKEHAFEVIDVGYLCGCDGARSTVRHETGIGFPGGTYEHAFFVADVEATGAAATGDDLNACLTPNGFYLVFPIRTSGMHRLIGTVPTALETRDPLTFEDIRPYLEQQIDVRVQKVNWFSRYQAHHRVANSFRKGRVFLAGDAGHIHSPMGGQGMNTGIGDAINLAWKLAAVVEGRADASLLDTYEPERIAFARSLVATTDTVFTLIAGQSFQSRLFRALAPRIAPIALRFDKARRLMFRTLSQTRISYRQSALSAGSAGEVAGGDRLPWVRAANYDNFAPLASLDWQIHVYGAAGEPLREAARDLGVELHKFAWTAEAEAAGLVRDALYLVRPDGHVALASTTQDVSVLRTYLSRFEIAPRVRFTPHETHLSADAGTSVGCL